MAEKYVPSGWLRLEKGQKVVFRTDRDSGRIQVSSRKQLHDLREIDKKFAGDEFRPEKLCFSKAQQKELISSRSSDNDVEIPMASDDTDIEELEDIEIEGPVQEENEETSVNEGPVQEENEEASVNENITQGEREELRLKKATKLLFVPVNQDPDHQKELSDAAKEMQQIVDNLTNTNLNFDLNKLQQDVLNANSVNEVCEALWAEPEIQQYFSVLENARVLSDLLRLSSIPENPLLEPVPDRKKSTYANIFFFALKHCKPLVIRLVNIVKASKESVQLTDVVTVSFYFSCLAHLASRLNSTVTKTKSLLLRKQGLSEKGMDGLAKLGITETDRNLRNFKFMLADLSETHFLAQVAEGLPYQVTTDNLDIGGHHLTQAYVELETRDTSALDTKPQQNLKIPDFFHFDSVQLYSEKNKALKEHMLYVAGISVAKRLAEESQSSKAALLKHLPAHHKHSHSHLQKNRAVLIIKKPEYLQETKNSEFVEYLRIEQWDFLISIAESMEDKDAYMDDLKLMKSASDKEVVETEEEVLKRKDAEERTKIAVAKFGEWIGHGDALTFKMFWLGAKSLCQGGVTALERLEFLNIFRIQLLHLKFNKVYMEYAKLMPSKNNITDVGTLAEMKALLPGLDKISNVDKEISKSFELHDQFYATVFQAKAGNAWLHYLNYVPGVLNKIKDEKSTVTVVLDFLTYFDIQFTFDPNQAPVDPEKYDDLQQYDREGIACWILSILIDDAEAEEDSELLEALRLTVMLEFLNKNAGGQQTSKYAYLLLLDRVVELLASERSRERMRNQVCVNPSGQSGGGLFRDKVNEHIVRMIKEVLSSMGISDNWGDLAIQKVVASVTPASLVTEHDLLSSGFGTKYKQHSSNLLGKERSQIVRQHVEEVATFSQTRPKERNFLKKPRGSPFQGLTSEAIKEFVKRNQSNFERNFPNIKK